MPAIEAEGLSYRYDCGREGLKQIDLEIHKGEFVAILGSNGSGKSTLARHLDALLPLQKGRLVVLSYDASDKDCIWKIRRNCGIVFQNPDNQFVSSVAEEDTAFGPENYGLSADEVRARTDEALRLTGMSAMRRRAPSTLSGGEKQRLALAGVLAIRPEIIIFDESFSMLDPQGRAELSGVVADLRKDHTIIFITHYTEEVTAADRILVMSRGTLLKTGTAKEILTDIPLLESAGLRAPKAVYMAKTLKAKGVPLEDGILTEEELAEAICRLH